MSTVKEIEQAIENLTAEDYRAFREWFEEYESDQWDSQIEQDIADGKLDRFAEQAVREYEAGRCREL